MVITLTSGAACAQHVPAVDFRRASFFEGRPMLPTRIHTLSDRRTAKLEVQNFKFMKDLGFKKPAFLPDFGLDKRKAALDKFYTSFDVQSLNEVIADDLKIFESDKLQKYGKKEWVTLLTEQVKPAIPDFSWSHLTTGEKDDEGYSIVRIQAVGHHTGKPFSLPGGEYPPVEATGQRFRLAEQTVKVKVEEGKIKEIKYLPKQGTGPVALYRALGGKAPAS